MSDYYVRKILDESQIRLIQELINRRDSEWSSGLRTFGDSDGHKKIKKNEEMTGPIESLNQITDIVFSGVDSTVKFFSFTAPECSGTPMITKTVPGGMYKAHHDSPDNGDFSTTVFLSDPETYSGGELCLNTLNGPLEFKLPAGNAITYKTGIPHQVNPVISGVRYVSVFWTKSKFKDPRIRKIWGDIKIVCSALVDKHGYGNLPVMENIEDVEQEPYFVLQNIMNDLERDFNQKM
jgi:PKHD-type hydroxylase